MGKKCVQGILQERSCNDKLRVDNIMYLSTNLALIICTFTHIANLRNMYM